MSLGEMFPTLSLQFFRVPNAWWSLPFITLLYLLSWFDRNTLFCTIVLVTMFWTCIVLWNKDTRETLSFQKLCKRRNNFRQQALQSVFITVSVCGEGGVYGHKHRDRKFGNFIRQIIWLSLFLNEEIETQRS